jgi:type I restriction-modification system DNA methylase subunit
MAKEGCSTCGKEFARKNGLQKHREKKIPCKSPTALIEKTLNTVLTEAGLPHLLSSTDEFREASKKFNASLTKEQRQDEGIFFTPKKVRDLLFEKLGEFAIKPKRILEPSFGTGEFLLDARRHFTAATIFGVEKNSDLFNSVKCPDSDLSNCDFLDWTGSADLILGNPPYFLMKIDTKEKREFKKENGECMTGRPNMYVKFLYKCIKDHLEPNGFLAFIIPTSLYNCSYYQPMRNYIQKNTTIRYLENLDKPGFHETTQDTMLIILEKNKQNDDYIFKSLNGNIYISPFYKDLYTYIEGSTTISELGLDVKTGNVVWNQVKENLSDEGGALLIYASNIAKSELKLGMKEGDAKKQYVKGIDKPTLSGPLILVSRGYGNSLHFDAVLVDLKEFYAENHVNVVYPTAPEFAKNLSRVMTSFQNEKTLGFIKNFFGNGSVSATELKSIIPIF